jgi:hypothetical protein
VRTEWRTRQVVRTAVAHHPIRPRTGVRALPFGAHHSHTLPPGDAQRGAHHSPVCSPDAAHARSLHGRTGGVCALLQRGGSTRHRRCASRCQQPATTGRPPRVGRNRARPRQSPHRGMQILRDDSQPPMPAHDQRTPRTRQCAPGVVLSLLCAPMLRTPSLLRNAVRTPRRIGATIPPRPAVQGQALPTETRWGGSNAGSRRPEWS